jgi:hypothetical protein
MAEITIYSDTMVRTTSGRLVEGKITRLRVSPSTQDALRDVLKRNKTAR